MYKNNEITNDDTAHRNDALKKDVFFLFFSFAACALYNDCTSNLWELKLDILIKAIFPYICFSTEFLLHILHDMSRERGIEKRKKKKKRDEFYGRNQIKRWEKFKDKKKTKQDERYIYSSSFSLLSSSQIHTVPTRSLEATIKCIISMFFFLLYTPNYGLNLKAHWNSDRTPYFEDNIWSA